METEDGVLKFVDNKGNYVTNEWRTGTENHTFLGSDGRLRRAPKIELTLCGRQGSYGEEFLVPQTARDGLKEEGWYFLGKNGMALLDGGRLEERRRRPVQL